MNTAALANGNVLSLRNENAANREQEWEQNARANVKPLPYRNEIASNSGDNFILKKLVITKWLLLFSYWSKW